MQAMRIKCSDLGHCIPIYPIAVWGRDKLALIRSFVNLFSVNNAQDLFESRSDLD